MGKEKGWMKIYRDVQEHWVWSDKPYSMGQAWIDLLLTANHDDVKIVFNGSMINVKTGQTITSVRKLAQKWGWSKDKTLKFLRMLISDGMIEKESDSFKTLITIVNYRNYQVIKDTKKTGIGHGVDTNKDTDKDTDSPQTRMIKNDKERKERKESASHTSLSSPSLDDEDDDEGYFKPDQWKEALAEWRKSNGE